MGVSDEEVLFGLIQSGVELCVRGIAIDLCTPLKSQGGADNWKVRCECGAQDDDGDKKNVGRVSAERLTCFAEDRLLICDGMDPRVLNNVAKSVTNGYPWTMIWTLWAQTE
ncbi:hypothetical protein HN51_043382 [Arachis hypogaea]